MADEYVRKRKDNTAFGKFLRTARLEKDLTQQQLANDFGYSKRQIYDLEKGYRLPSGPDVLRLARLLEVNPAALGKALLKDMPSTVTITRPVHPAATQLLAQLLGGRRLPTSFWESVGTALDAVDKKKRKVTKAARR